MNAQAQGDIVLERPAPSGCDGHSRLRSRRMRTPQAFAARLGAWPGPLYGLFPDASLTILRCAAKRAVDLRSLVFTGGTSCPDGDAPTLTLSVGIAGCRVLVHLGEKPRCPRFLGLPACFWRGVWATHKHVLMS